MTGFVRVEWSIINHWTDLILSDDLGPITNTFMENGADAPEVNWIRSADQLSSEPFRFLMTQWTASRGGMGVPDICHIDPFILKPALGNMIIFEPIDGERDFRYRLHGTNIAFHSQVDMTNQLLSCHPASFYVRQLSIAVNRACLRRRMPIFTRRSPIGAQYTAKWDRLALPFANERGAARVLAAMIAIDRRGNPCTPDQFATGSGCHAHLNRPEACPR
jgi:hypothetical protein